MSSEFLTPTLSRSCTARSGRKFYFDLVHHSITMGLCEFVLRTEEMEGFGLMILTFQISTVTSVLRYVWGRGLT